MISKHKLFKHPDYLLSKYQAEVYRQLQQYMDDHGFTQKEVAKHLGVSGSYVNQILNGNFNFTLKKLIELSLMMGKVPTLEFVDINDYLAREGSQNSKNALGKATTEKRIAVTIKSKSPGKSTGKVKAVKSVTRT
ncbi:Transcriptional regulator, contains XRE-family HTH domain [Chryseolinea serpens]|uniref:Transcriptional regulator, contains XRE-family HTH domain n=1 Tax=Chryseolinea serpens TaxID=947013 RepID=A0A1M5VRI8_9BACT|nr:helix-turn-helix transcriptional regulator [Chryseolinea serpens]SHH77584.1 Transcriptional regulator, contains XRE-family HTH domain [Chryseolinea serpens]